MKKCVIKIKDEVTCTLEGLSPESRRALHRKFEYEVPGARFQPSVRLGRWNGKVSYFSLAGSTYINLLEDIIPFLEESDYDIELDDSRPYREPFEFEYFTEETFSNKCWPNGHPAAGQPITLRDYQVSIVNHFLQNPQCIQVAPTGAGKTLITAALSHSVEKYGRSIIIVPNKSLVTQTESDYINLGLDVGVYFGDRKETGRTHTICTWQSVLNIIKNTANGVGDISIGEFIEDVICVICDEVHTAKADALRNMLSGVLAHVPIRWGLTGTIPKEEISALSLYLCIGPVINKLEAKTLQDTGVLSKCHVNIIQTGDGVEFKDYQTELKYLLSNKERLDTIGNLMNEISESGNTLILVDRVQAGKDLLERIPGAVFISGETKLKDRKSEYDAVASSDAKVIIATYGVAAVGINIPRIFNLVLIEPGKSFTRVIQSIGRGLRVAEDKDFVTIYDITSNCKFAKRHLTTRKAFYREVKYPFTQKKLEYR